MLRATVWQTDRVPMSSAQGKDWTKAHVYALATDGPVTVLDIGPGVGTYAKLLAGPQVSGLTGIEIWEPYVHTYRLRDYYDEVIVGDARLVAWPEADVVIMGDVAEHMTVPEAQTLWDKAIASAQRAIYLSIPIVHYPQGHIEGNPHEHHVVDDWNHDKVLDSFPGIQTWWRGSEVGVYERLVER